MQETQGWVLPSLQGSGMVRVSCSSRSREEHFLSVLDTEPQLLAAGRAGGQLSRQTPGFLSSSHQRFLGHLLFAGLRQSPRLGVTQGPRVGANSPVSTHQPPTEAPQGLWLSCPRGPL